MRRLLIAALLLGGFAALAPSPSPASASASAEVTPPVAPERGERHDLSGDAITPPAVLGRAAARTRTWPGSTIRYHETIPAAWDWSLDQAIAHWNDAGGGIRFVETGRARAQLRISYGDTGGADGVGTLGYQRSNYVHLSPSYKRADEHDPETRVWVGRLFTHELGHVLGFSHTRGACSLMYPVYDFNRCPPLPTAAPGYYNCRWIDRPLLRRFIAWYGGRARQAPAHCLIEELPGTLGDVRFSGGAAEGGPVTITWQPPATVRAGTRVWVTVWHAASCARVPETWERRQAVAPGVGSWTDRHYGQGPWCYRVEIVNRYGAARPATVEQVDRWAPVPDAPQAGSPEWLAGQAAWRFTWPAPDGTELAVVRNLEDPETCPDGTDDWTALDHPGGDRWILHAFASEECVLLVATTGWGTVSAGTPVELSVPGVTDAPVVGRPEWVPEAGGFRVSWTPPDELTHLEVVRSAAEPEACPTSYDPDRAEWPWEDGPDTWFVASNEAEECVTFFAVTSWGGVSPGTSVRLEVPVPDAPAVPAPEWIDADARWRVTWSPPASTGLGVVRNGQDPSSCPTSTDEWVPLEQEGDDRWILDSWASVECVLLVGHTDWGTVSEGTPVQLRVPGLAEAPDVGTPTWVRAEGSFRISWSPPDEVTRLAVIRPVTDGTCPTSHADGFEEEATSDGPGQWLVWANRAHECVLLVAVSPQGVSPGTAVVLQVPAPTVSAVVGDVVRDPATGELTVSAAVERGPHELGVEVVAGGCPGQPPADAGWGDGHETTPGTWALATEGVGAQCALFAALDGFGQHGPVVARAFTVP